TRHSLLVALPISIFTLNQRSLGCSVCSTDFDKDSISPSSTLDGIRYWLFALVITLSSDLAYLTGAELSMPSPTRISFKICTSSSSYTSDSICTAYVIRVKLCVYQSYFTRFSNAEMSVSGPISSEYSRLISSHVASSSATGILDSVWSL